MKITTINTLTIPSGSCGIELDRNVYVGLENINKFVKRYQPYTFTTTTTTPPPTTTTLPPWHDSYVSHKPRVANVIESKLPQSLLGAAAAALILYTLQPQAVKAFSTPTPDILRIHGELEVQPSQPHQPPEFEWSKSLYRAWKAAEEYGSHTHADY